MKAYKKLLSSDKLITPFKVNKYYSFQGSASLHTTDYRIERLYMNPTSTLISSGSIPDFEEDDKNFYDFYNQYPFLIYNSIFHLYYSNFSSSSLGDEPSLPYTLPGVDSTYDVLLGDVSSSGRYYNYPQSDILFEKIFSEYKTLGKISGMGVISIPSKLYGDNILPKSLSISSSLDYISDDGEGNILNTNGDIVGNIFYSHGIITIFGEASYVDSFINEESEINLNFASSLTIYETQYKCTLNSNEFNYTQNPSAIKGSLEDSNYKDFINSPSFTPYITTVGLYNDNNELLVVGKLSSPIPKSQFVDTTILVNIDQ